LAFDYDGEIVAADETRAVASFKPQSAARCLRNASAERAAGDRLRQLGWRAPAYRAQGDRTTLEIAASRLPQVVQELTAEGWHVEAHGKVYRSAGRFDLIVSSGIDWFELRGSVAFGETVAQLPELLAAVKRGENMVRLGDGSFGLLPQQWLKRYGLLAMAGTTQEDHVRFTRSQVGLLDALMSAQPEAQCDAMFSRIRDELKGFRGLQAADPPAGFRGELRPYQKEGLGWLEFLRRFGFGGCLADNRRRRGGTRAHADWTHHRRGRGLRIKLVHEMVAPDDLMPAALKLARSIAENNAYGVWQTKIGLNAALDAPSLRHAIEIENRTRSSAVSPITRSRRPRRTWRSGLRSGIRCEAPAVATAARPSRSRSRQTSLDCGSCSPAARCRCPRCRECGSRRWRR